jgi:hypothetical protein
MVITVVPMWVVKVTVDQVVDVITVRNWFMTASRSMNMPRIMLPTIVCRRAIIGIRRAYRNCMLFNDTIIPHVMKMSIMKVVCMLSVSDARVAASRTMDMIVIVMSMIVVGVVHHKYLRHVLSRNWIEIRHSS